MCDTGIWKKANHLILPMSLKARTEMTDGKTALHSEQPDSSSTVPLRSHQDFNAMYAQTRAPATSDKGKGKGKNKEKGKDKKRQRNERRW